MEATGWYKKTIGGEKKDREGQREGGEEGGKVGGETGVNKVEIRWGNLDSRTGESEN